MTRMAPSGSAKMPRSIITALLFATTLLASGPAAAQDTKPYEPIPGQPGKDVVWVPTPDALVETMLDMAKVTPADFVIDLGSGDGRNVIAAAKRGVPALGIEYNEKMVALARARAEEAGVATLAKFEQGDMYAADISKATVLALFLLPDNLRRLEPKFRALRPGTRIVVNSFGVPDWKPEVTETLTENCTSWCTAMLYRVPPQDKRP